MPAYFVVRAVVAEADRRDFDHWYRTEHLPDAVKAFAAQTRLARLEPHRSIRALRILPVSPTLPRPRRSTPRRRSARWSPSSMRAGARA